MWNDTVRLMRGLGYPEAWLEEAAEYGDEDAYVAFDPSWVGEFPEIPEQTVDQLVRRQAEKSPNSPALRYLGRTLSYADFEDLIGRAAGVLRAQGVGKGDVVAVMVPTSAMHWVVFFALARLGAVHCGVNVMYRADELSYQLADAGANAIVCLDHFLPLVEGLPPEVRPTHVLSTTLGDLADPTFQPYGSLHDWWKPHGGTGSSATPLLEAMRSVEPIRESSDADVRTELGQIVYTSGTTGRPKGVMQTHYNMIHNALTHTLAMVTTTTPVTYSPMPMFHTGGFFVYSLPVFARGGVVVPRPLFDPSDALACITEERVNVLFGPPTLFAALLAHGLDGYDLAGIEICATGAAPVPKDLARRWKAATGLVMRSGWGMSELNSLGTYNALPGRTDLNTVGVPVVGEMRVVNVSRDVVGRDEVGEIEFRGMQVSRGYLGKPDETAITFQPDGWVRTGDAGLINRNGFLEYVDRIKDLIIVSGYNVAPAEIEAVIRAVPGVTEVAVVGEPHEYKGEVPVAYVSGDVTERAVLDFCQQKLSKIKVPARVQVMEELPKSSMGKVMKGRLGQHARDVR
ncbi:class I adenylate-forming enzyme family protein [Pseudonocardia spinosispora]|uniref:class I adenylate-forming enzyme family protein n=1 Tax=Pseudonocardia spinosispora TaxID=103441 RepID=UPI0009FC8383|nr:class I adenylate-forming enzyme family protein [Pseudonocardia spinosispora]